MGHKKQIDLVNVVTQINAAAYEVSSPYNDGYTSWGYKQDLYRIKWILDNALKKCPTFVDEQEWVREQEKVQVIKILSEK